MPERPRQRPPQQSYNQSPENNQTRRIRHVPEQSQDIVQATTEDEIESIDPEATLYLKNLTEDWANINLVNTKIIPISKKHHRKQNTKRWNMDPNNMQQLRKNWVARRHWIAPKLGHWINQSTAKKLMTNKPNIKIERYNKNKRYRCFNNKEIKIKGVIHLNITSGNWLADVRYL